MTISKLRSAKALVAFLAALMITPPLRAQELRQEENATITVEGVRRQDVERMIGDLAPSRGERQIAKWRSGICVKVGGLMDSHAVVIRDRITTIARNLKIRVEESGNCQPNIIIVFTDKPRDILLEIRRRYPGILRDPRYGLARKSEWENFLAPRPVTWMGQDEIDDTIASGAPSRIILQTRQIMTVALAVVDANMVSGITWGQLADYLCMVTLSRPLLDVTYGPSTILGLFTVRDLARAGPAGLTKIDKSTLETLYSMEDRLSAATQLGILRKKVIRELDKAED